MPKRTDYQPQALPAEGFIRLPLLLAVIPWGKSKLWDACRKGEFPKPIKLSERITVWDVRQIRDYIESKRA